MSTETEKAPSDANHTSFGEASARRHWLEHVPRTTAVLAIVAAVSSGQYANQFSRTILAQAEASDQWSYYQAKSIKRHLINSQIEMLQAMGKTRPDVAPELAKLEENDRGQVKKYEQDLAEAKVKADAMVADKDTHQKQGDRFQLAFIILQAGVVLSTIAASARRKELWFLAIACGLLGLIVVADGYLLIR
jgi:hypothetical protein